MVPGGGEASPDEFPAPLGLLPALFDTPGLTGPDGAPLIPEVPVPAEPALGEPGAALPLPVDEPLAPCANELTGEIGIAIAAIAAIVDDRFIENLPLPFNDAVKSLFPAEMIATGCH